jgi:hypothetical protein
MPRSIRTVWTDAKVAELRERYERGESFKDMADYFGVSMKSIWGATVRHKIRDSIYRNANIVPDRVPVLDSPNGPLIGERVNVTVRQRNEHGNYRQK